MKQTVKAAMISLKRVAKEIENYKNKAANRKAAR
jgi:hypothetical protein